MLKRESLMKIGELNEPLPKQLRHQTRRSRRLYDDGQNVPSKFQKIPPAPERPPTSGEAGAPPSISASIAGASFDGIPPRWMLRRPTVKRGGSERRASVTHEA